MEKIRIRDPGWKKVGSGMRDKHPGSATLMNEILNDKQVLEMLKNMRENFFCYSISYTHLRRIVFFVIMTLILKLSFWTK
jgi:hypothetical protein